jgi:NAD(P) transhydrogenase subunit alpha
MQYLSSPVLSAPFASQRLCVKSRRAALAVAFAVGFVFLTSPITHAQAPDTAVLPTEAAAVEVNADSARDEARQTLIISVTIFVLAIFVGFELISKVPATLHTPLMSGSNAISGITVVGAIIAAGAIIGATSVLGFIATVLAMINVVGGFLVTHRMLRMFKRR